MQVIGTAGHVDHGKSTLVQRLTGIDPDRWDEEKRRGLTIDLGFAWLPLPSGREVGLIDVPGHERFIKNMLAGAGGITVTLFVVAANEGWMPQSAEHLAILDVLGVSHGVVALTKTDLIDDDAVARTKDDVERHLAPTSLAGAPVVPVSAQNGTGLDELVAALDQAIASAPPAPDKGRPRLWIDRVFTIAGAGTVVTGTLAGGSLHVGDHVDIAPEGRKARIRGIQNHKRSLEDIGPGNRVALNLSGLDREAAARGDAVVTSDRWSATRVIDTSLRVLSEEVTGIDHKLTPKGAHLLYAGSAETPVTVQLLDKDAAGPGETAFAQLRLRKALPLERGDRFVLRDAGRVLTFGGGVVLDPLASPVGRGKADRAELLSQLVGAGEEDALDVILASEREVPIEEVFLRVGAERVPPGAARLGDRLVSASRLEELQRLVRDRLREHHKTRPLEQGAQREAVRADVGLPGPAFHDLIAGMDDVEERGALLAMNSFSVKLDSEQERRRVELLSRIDEGGYSPPVAEELGGDPALIRSLIDAGDLVRISNFYLTRDGARNARARVRGAIHERGPLSVAEIRDLLGTTRKYAVPLCEWLDATGATVRKGDTRILGPNE
jgi:selenocysteine-specific elongation factor